jgi:hypothetical protein
MQTEVPKMLDFGFELTRLVSRDFIPVIFCESFTYKCLSVDRIKERLL